MHLTFTKNDRAGYSIADALLTKGRHRLDQLDYVYLDVRSATSASWVFWYRNGGKNKIELGLGSAFVRGVATMSAKVENKAKRFVGMLLSDLDPQSEQVRTGLTVADMLIEEIEARESGTTWGERETWLGYKDNWFPRLASMRPANVQRSHILDVLRAGWKSKRVTAERVLYVLDAIFTRAALHDGVMPANKPNPADTAAVATLLGKGGKQEAKLQASLPFEQAPAWMLRVLTPTKGDGWRSMGNRRKALLVAGTIPHRSGEVYRMKRADVNLDTGMWITPAEDNKKGHEQVNRLPWQVVAVLRSIPEVEGNPYFFAGAKPGQHIAPGAMLEVLRDEMKVTKDEANVHGFRSTIVTWAGSALGIETQVLKDMLSHKIEQRKKGKDGDSLPRYYRPEVVAHRGEVLQKWADFIFPADFANEGGNIVQLRAA
jgi:hypothetical protein